MELHILQISNTYNAYAQTQQKDLHMKMNIDINMEIEIDTDDHERETTRHISYHCISVHSKKAYTN